MAEIKVDENKLNKLKLELKELQKKAKNKDGLLTKEDVTSVDNYICSVKRQIKDASKGW